MKKELRENLKDLRTDHDWTQRKVAEYLNVAQQTYSQYENGKRQIPVSVVVKLAELYQVSTDYLLGSAAAYPGNIDLNAFYVGKLTMHKLIFKLQSLTPFWRRIITEFLLFLIYRMKKKNK